MATGNHQVTYTFKILGDIKDIMSKVDTVKGGFQNIFNASNLGQSLKGDFNQFERIMERLKKNVSAPIHGDWGAQTILNDLQRSNDALDEMARKIHILQNESLKDRIKLLDQKEIDNFNKVEDYLTKLPGQLQKVAEAEKKVAKARANRDNQKNTTIPDIEKRLASARAAYSAAETYKLSVDTLTKDDYKNQVEELLRKVGIYTNSYAMREPIKRGLKINKTTFDLENTFDVNSLVSQAKDLKNSAGEFEFNPRQLKNLEEALKKIIQLKKDYAEYKLADDTFKQAEANVVKYEKELASAQNKLVSFEQVLNDAKINKTNAFNTQEFQDFLQVAQQMGVTLSNLDENSSLTDIETEVNKVKAAFEAMTQGPIANAKAELEKYIKELQKVKDATDQDRIAQQKHNEAMAEVKSIESRIKHFTSFFGILTLVRRAVRSAVNTIKELDEQMTKMAVVTSPTISDYWKQLPEYTKRANALGAAIKDVYEADTLYYQQGLKTNQVMQVSNETMKMARIAALDAAEATNRMTAAMRGFNMEINQTSAQRVNDVYSQLAAITASDVNEISTAMTKTASIAHSAGMEFETTAAFLSQIIETTRESADTAGTALKTIIARFEELKKSPSEIGEIDGEVVDANKIETALRSVGIALRDTKGQFRDLDDVFMELASKWDGLDKNTQRYIATMAAGSRQQSRFIAMMQNYKHTVDLVDKANTSAGASQKQFEKTLDSMKTKLNALKNAWNTFTMGILNSEFTKGILSFGTGVLQILNKTLKVVDKLNISVVSMTARIGVLYASLKAIRKLGITATSWWSAGKESAVKGGSFWTGFNPAVNISAGISNVKNNFAQKAAARGYMEYARSKGRASAVTRAEKQLAKWNGVVPTNNKKFDLYQQMGTKAILGDLGKMVIALGQVALVIGAIVLAVKGIQAWVAKIKYESEEEKIKRDKEALENYNEQLKKTKELLESIKTAREGYETIRKELNDAIQGTDDWKQKLKEVNNQVLELVSTYKDLAKYVKVDAITGELSISTKGWNELENKQNQKIENQTIITQNQQRKVNKNAANQLVKTYEKASQGLGNFLGNLSIKELQKLSIDEKQITSISSLFNVADADIKEAIRAVLENKETIQSTEETIKLTNQLLNNEKEDGEPPIEYAQWMGVQAREEEKRTDRFFKRLDDTYTYENEAAKEILRFYEIDPDVINGRGDTEILAILKGAVNGITDINESIDKYSSQTGWGKGRNTIAREISQAYMAARATQDAQIDKIGYQNFLKENSLFTKYIKDGAGGLTLTEKEEILKNAKIRDLFEEWMQANNIKQSIDQVLGIDQDKENQERFDYYVSGEKDVINKKKEIDEYKESHQADEAFLEYLVNSDYLQGYSKNEIAEALKNKEIYDYLIKYLSDDNRISTSAIQQSAELEEKYPIAEGLAIAAKRKKSEVGGGTKFIAGLGIYLNGLQYFTDQLNELYSELPDFNFGKDFNEATKDLSATLQGRLRKVFIDAAAQQEPSPELAEKMLNNFFEIWNDPKITKEQKEQFANLLTSYDLTDTKSLEKLKKVVTELQDDFGDLVTPMLNFIDMIGDLNNAIEKINLSDVSAAIKNLGLLIDQIKNNKWEGFLTEEQVKALKNLAGFDENKFYQDKNQQWHYDGSTQDLVNALTNSYKEGIIDNELSLEEKLSKAIERKELKDIKEIKEMPFENEADEEALRNAVREALNLLTQEERDRLQPGDIDTLEESDLKDLYEKLYNKGLSYQTDKETVKDLGTQFSEVMEHWGGIFKDAFDGEQDALRTLDAEITNLGLDTTNKSAYEEYKTLQGKGKENLTRQEKRRLEELVKYFTTRISFSQMKESLVDVISTAVEASEELKDIPLNTQEAFDIVDNWLKKTGINAANVTEKEAKAYYGLISTLANGTEEEAYEAYKVMCKMVLQTNNITYEALNQVNGAFYNNLEGTLKDAADLLVKWKLAFIKDGYVNLADSTSFFNWQQKANGGKDKNKEEEPWKDPYDWLWNITQQINKVLYQRERLERKYKLAVEDSLQTTKDLYDISKKELNNLQEQARLQSLKGQKATEEAQLLLSSYKEYAKYVSMNPLTGQVQVAYEDLDKQHWSQEKGSAFESYVEKLVELGEEIRNSNEALENIEDEVEEIRKRGREELIDFQNRVKEALVTERQREIDTLQDINDTITDQQADLLDAMREEVEETRRIRENTDKQEEIEKKRQKLAYLQRDTSGANQTEILALQEEIKNDEQAYTDSLLDQSLEKIQQENELAAEQRQQQIDIMNFQLTRWQESGEIWKSVDDLLNSFFDGDSGNLQAFVREQENWQSLSRLQQEDFDKEFIQTGKLAKLFNEGHLYDDAKEIKNAVEAYSKDLANVVSKTGVLGRMELDNGNHLKVTLKDYNPKQKDVDSITGGLNSANQSLDSILGWLNDYDNSSVDAAHSDPNRANWMTSLQQGMQKSGIKTEDIMTALGWSKDIKLDQLNANQLMAINESLRDVGWDLSTEEKKKKFKQNYKAYGFATGGLNTQAGPAWLDGTPSKPEYVLNAEQTRAFFSLVDNVNTISKDGNAKGNGDNYFNVEVNVDEISNDYDVDRAIDRVKQAILEDSNYRNVNFISGFTF